MLDEVVLTHASGFGCSKHFPRGGKLVIAGKDQCFLLRLLARGRISHLLLLEVDKPMDDVEPTIFLPDLLPQVTRFVTRRILVGGRIALAPRAARVEGEEICAFAQQACRHEHFIGI